MLNNIDKSLTQPEKPKNQSPETVEIDVPATIKNLKRSNWIDIFGYFYYLGNLNYQVICGYEEPENEESACVVEQTKTIILIVVNALLLLTLGFMTWRQIRFLNDCKTFHDFKLYQRQIMMRLILFGVWVVIPIITSELIRFRHINRPLPFLLLFCFNLYERSDNTVRITCSDRRQVSVTA
ncbi:hypothetical protein BKA69DRAFT_76609 [Paraphysoderma sedebokerense]|nr:hypothetical protein BKA69DRAFT_76609 [Paraphysoderma sedebokerense]